MTSSAFQDHLQIVASRWDKALAFAGFDAVVVLAGEAKNHFLDDQGPPFKANPHFIQWCPDEVVEGSALLLAPGQTPRLYFLQPDDYWHQPPTVPEWAATFEVSTFADPEALDDELQQAARRAGNHIALIGESERPGFQPQDVNPTLLLNHLHFHRAVKTPFELACMREATRKAVLGHAAARAAFEAGASEFSINHAYLGAAQLLPSELPYQNIVALNEHAGILHYQHYDRSAPATILSFLIDAGGGHLGYAADITRTYAADGRSLFAELIERLDSAQQALIETIEPGVPYLDLHVDMHWRLAGILKDSGLATGSVEAIFETGVTETFLPHGLGHLIGLQTHDVGGQQTSTEGGMLPPPDNYSSLRLTRTLTADMPVTIEPGLYFIPQLLESARRGENASLIQWHRVDDLLPCGGIRIEDNVVPGATGVENLTRAAFASL